MFYIPFQIHKSLFVLLDNFYFIKRKTYHRKKEIELRELIRSSVFSVSVMYVWSKEKEMRFIKHKHNLTILMQS